MTQNFDLMMANATVWTPSGPLDTSIGIRDGKIAGLGVNGDAQETIDCVGLHILPGIIDSHVYFREPGLEHKEDIESGSRAAVLGGVTTVFEMPNKPTTDSADALAQKLHLAHGRAWCDHAFYIGATTRNIEDLAELERLPGAAGVKLFMGTSTGDLLDADDREFTRVLAHGSRPVAVHAEDETRLQQRAGLRVENDPSSHPIWRDDECAMLATRRIVRLAREAGRRIHITHVTTPAEMAFLSAHRDIATCEVNPQHLTLAAEDAYPRIGTHAQMNPPIRSSAHRDGLWHWVRQGVPDVLGSDHAPHTLEEKAQAYPASPSGMPGVQTMVPVMLDHIAHGRLTMERFIDLTSSGPERVFGLLNKGRIAVGYDADLTIVDLKLRWTLTRDWLASRAGWSPFEDMQLTGKPVGTFVRGERAMWDGELVNRPRGRPASFAGADLRSRYA